MTARAGDATSSGPLVIRQSLQGKYAGFASRFTAFAVDMGVSLGVFMPPAAGPGAGDYQERAPQMAKWNFVAMGQAGRWERPSAGSAVICGGACPALEG